eukprot:CAMPEP_0178767190 /NCGR_PEP_ID=MMETSP0744-20121128/19501_1 /TAXON_ID=913974 /ORGANISM="Nitzschia punctata, Strain CCMP561" /LENGTH=651 /DNA_ID=CAMNT_0020423033 /DNA_START=137 /DNA_END=2092 /DNA_ORIENTATION=+
MSDAIASVIVASAQSVAKVFVIGGIGYGAVKFPRKAPFLPRTLVGTVARFTFHALTIPLIYSTIGVAVSIESVGNYWFLIVGGFFVLGISYVVATLLRRCFSCCFHITNENDFRALRVASTFPNIVALPILIFPSLCEFPVVYEGYAVDYPRQSSSSTADTVDNDYYSSASGSDLQRECVAQSTTMIFCYFFAWSLAFWSFGNPQLMRAATNTANANHRLDNSHHTTISNSSFDGDRHHHHHHHHHHGEKQQQKDESDENDKDNNQSQNKETSSNTVDACEVNTNRAAESVSKSMQEVEEGRMSKETEAHELTLSNTTTDTSPKSDPIIDCGQESGAAKRNIHDNEATMLPTVREDQTTVQQSASAQSATPGVSAGEGPSFKTKAWKTLEPFWHAIKQTTTSPGFIAMVLAFITACIPPLQRALFEPGGALRFFGSAMEALGTASSPISTIVVAASLVPPRPEHHSETQQDTDEDESSPIIDERPGMTDPNFGPYQRPRRRQRNQRRASSSRFSELRRSMRSSSMRILQAIPRSTPEMRRLHLWFNLSRLIVTPAVVVGLILALDCSPGSSILSNVPNLAKLVIIINSALPGALIVVVLLKAKEELADTAAAVSKVYLPSYLISIFSIAAWSAIGLWVTLPDENGNTFCQR